MTRHGSGSVCLADPDTTDGSSDAVLARIWEDVPFPRLPLDAPAELREYVCEVDNPKRVYAVHRATRRHGFQLLVEK